ncbi:MAG: hypothetical protein ACP5NQ_01505 [Vulcanisaeta sp.]
MLTLIRVFGDIIIIITMVIMMREILTMSKIWFLNSLFMALLIREIEI